jgi:hypothetical protein
MSYSYNFKTKEEEQKYYEDHKAEYLEKLECKDCKKFISKINLKRHVLTKTHINNFNKVKIEKFCQIIRVR